MHIALQKLCMPSLQYIFYLRNTFKIDSVYVSFWHDVSAAEKEEVCQVIKLCFSQYEFYIVSVSVS
uniref:Uncharacterized protein n=1 Tax=Anguilla anguilla TaxID=7936 RepID=A0A0E9QB79_ANGAN